MKNVYTVLLEIEDGDIERVEFRAEDVSDALRRAMIYAQREYPDLGACARVERVSFAG